MKTADRACSHKMQYTRSDALNIAKMLRSQHVRMGGRKRNTVRAYHCQHCNFWHVGHDGAPSLKPYKREAVKGNNQSYSWDGEP